MEETLVFTRREVNFALLASAIAIATGALPFGAVARKQTHLFDFAIAGGYYHHLKQALPDLQPGVELRLQREPENPFDGNAIEVLRADGLKLGYIPRAANVPVARLMDDGVKVDAKVVRMLDIAMSEDIPGELVFTGFTAGDPMIRLTAEISPL